MECSRCPVQSIIDAFIKTDSLSLFVGCSDSGNAKNARKPHRLAPFAQNIQTALSNMCQECSKYAHDENPSNHGRSFVSLDACSISDSHASSAPSVSSAFDYLVGKISPDFEQYRQRPYEQIYHQIDGEIDDSKKSAKSVTINERQKSDKSRHAQHEHHSENEPSNDDTNGHASVTNLPPDVEDTLRMNFANFAMLSPIDLCLIAHLMAGNSLASFASMNWANVIRYDPVTKRPKPISRQAAFARFKSICRKIPVFMALAKSEEMNIISGNFNNAESNTCSGRENSRLQMTPVTNRVRYARNSHRFDNPNQLTLFN